MPVRAFATLFLFGCTLAACVGDSSLPARTDDRGTAGAVSNPAQAIVDRAIAVHGGAVLDHAVVSFDFRDRHFTVTRDGGRYRYVRTYTDSTGAVQEVLSNDGITREVNGSRVSLTPEETRKLSTPLNSVPYFALLPYNLKDPAVIKRLLGTVTLEGEPYDKVEVTFRKEGGGRDYEDRFVYWFHRERHTMDYLAYGFHVDDGGTRFRKAVNVRTVGGVRFADYLNYISDALPDPASPIETYDARYSSGDVEMLSEVNLENVTVTPLDR